MTLCYVSWVGLRNVLFDFIFSSLRLVGVLRLARRTSCEIILQRCIPIFELIN